MKPKSRILIYLFLIGLGFIGIFINAVWGNPVSKVVAEIQVNNFIKENFNNRELKVYKIEYNLINSGYVAEIIDNKTKLNYRVTADELGVKYQNILPNYVYKERFIKYPSNVIFLSIGSIGVILSLGYFIRKKINMKRSLNR